MTPQKPQEAREAAGTGAQEQEDTRSSPEPLQAHSRLIEIWKHDCRRDGEVTSAGIEQPCDPPCEEPWQVDAPFPHGDTFATYAQAVEYTAQLLKDATK